MKNNKYVNKKIFIDSNSPICVRDVITEDYTARQMIYEEKGLFNYDIILDNINIFSVKRTKRVISRIFIKLGDILFFETIDGDIKLLTIPIGTIVNKKIPVYETIIEKDFKVTNIDNSILYDETSNLIAILGLDYVVIYNLVSKNISRIQYEIYERMKSSFINYNLSKEEIEATNKKYTYKPDFTVDK